MHDRKSSGGIPTTRIEPWVPPSDPPNIKGLGIPPLHVAVVGDADAADQSPIKGPGTLAERQAELFAGPPVLDLKF